jgi:hypothetical protein
MEFLSRSLEPVKLSLEDISGSVYEVGDNLKNCTFYRFDPFLQKVGASTYIAVPNDSSPPFI